MPNTYFRFKNFIVHHDRCAMKVTTDSCLFGAWCALEIARLCGHIHTIDLPTTSVLDIGSGTGLLSLMIAQQVDVTIDAVEIDTEAATQSSENVAGSPYASSINVINSDILKFHTAKCYRFIVSNPPFYEKEIVSSVHGKNVAHHGTHLKIEQLLDVVDKYLTADGQFFMLLPYKRLNEVEGMLIKRKYCVTKKLLVSQTPGHTPFRAMLQLSRQAFETNVDQMLIRGNKNEYSPTFTSLLKDYYLYL